MQHDSAEADTGALRKIRGYRRVGVGKAYAPEPKAGIESHVDSETIENRDTVGHEAFPARLIYRWNSIIDDRGAAT
jgi:hypothetical protein